MRDFVKKHLKTLLFFTLVGLFGGFFTGIYLLESYPEEIKNQLINEIKATMPVEIDINILMGIITAVQSAFYGLVLGGIGIILAKKVGLWKDERKIESKPLLVTVVASIVFGLAMILPDIFFFGRFSDAILNSYASKPTVSYILACVTYGAVIEEVMLRLFTLSLVAFILHFIFERSRGEVSEKILICANIVCALLFAVGHLPGTFIILGSSPMIIFRCILLNGAGGLIFGYLYRKYGLRYAMIAHGGCHIVSKLIWILFL